MTVQDLHPDDERDSRLWEPTPNRIMREGALWRVYRCVTGSMLDPGHLVMTRDTDHPTFALELPDGGRIAVHACQVREDDDQEESMRLVFIYQAALLCHRCGNAVRERLTSEGKAPAQPDNESTYDSKDFPKVAGVEGDGQSEADSPQHCDQCHAFLHNRLTSDGDAFVDEAVRRFVVLGEGRFAVLMEWVTHYGYTSDVFSLIKARQDLYWCDQHEDCKRDAKLAVACSERRRLTELARIGAEAAERLARMDGPPRRAEAAREARP